MKIMIETSVYCFIIAFSCFLFLEFITMNGKISEVSQTTAYIQDYIEIHGKSLGDVANGYQLDEETIEVIKTTAEKQNMEFTYTYDSETDTYVYYKVQLTYDLRMGLFDLQKDHTYDGLTRTLRPV